MVEIDKIQPTIETTPEPAQKEPTPAPIPEAPKAAEVQDVKPDLEEKLRSPVKDMDIEAMKKGLEEDKKTQVKSTLVNFIVPLIAFGIILVLGLVVIYPSLSGYSELKGKYDGKVSLSKQLDKKISDLNKLTDFRLVVDENAGIVTQVLPSEAMVPELLTQVDTVARESGLDVTKLSYSLGDVAQDSEIPAGYDTVIVNLGVAGNYVQIQTFLKNLETSARLVDVNVLRFSKDTADEAEKFNATFILQAPYLVVNASAVTDDPIDLNVGARDFVEFMDALKKFKVYEITAEAQFEDLEEEVIDEEDLLEEDIPEESDLTPEEIEDLISDLE